MATIPYITNKDRGKTKEKYSSSYFDKYFDNCFSCFVFGTFPCYAARYVNRQGFIEK